jgi:hypothetical protein
LGHIGHEEIQQVGQSELDPEMLLRQLKARNQVLQWEPIPPRPPRPGVGTEQQRSRESLDYLHANWALPDAFDPATVGGDTKGKALGLFGRLTFRVLGPYLRRERDLLSHLVRVNEALESRCDALTARVEQMAEDDFRRQEAEAANLARLALWLHLDGPDASVAPAVGTNGSTSGRPAPS